MTKAGAATDKKPKGDKEGAKPEPKRFTVKGANAMKPGDKRFTTSVTGLTLRPGSTKGHGNWVFRFTSTTTNTRREMGLGSFPEIGHEEAKKRGEAARKLLVKGIDPIEDGKRKEQEEVSVPTFEQSARERCETLAKNFSNAKHQRDWISSLEIHAFPSIGSRKVDTLTPQDFADVLEPIWLDRAETARRVKQRCWSVMAVHFAKGLIKSNPVDVVDVLLSTQPEPDEDDRQPSMDWRLVPEFVRDHLLREPVLGARAALLWTILTAARSQETRFATWDEIDAEERSWTLVKTRMKKRRKHKVALSDAALHLLEQQPREQDTIFPSLRGKKLSDAAMSQITRRNNAPSDVDGLTATVHGFRSSFKNWATDNGFPDILSEKALAHKDKNKVRAAYLRTDMFDARQPMMEAWGYFVMGESEKYDAAMLALKHKDTVTV